MQIDKEDKRQRANFEKNKAIVEQKILPRVEDYERELSSSSISMYTLEFGEQGSKFLSNQTPTIAINNDPHLTHEEEIGSSPITKKVMSKRHLVVP